MAYFNDMLQQMTGFEATELMVGEVCSIDPIILSEDRSHVVRIVEDAIRDNMSFEVEYRIKHKDGSIRYFLERGRPIYGDDKQPEFIDGVILDFTEHKQVEEALRESEEKFRSLVEKTSDWLWELDADGSYTFSSSRVRDLLGYEPEEVLGRKPFEFMPPDDSARIREEFCRIVRKREAIVRIENVYIGRNGRRVVLETSGVPKLDAQGDFLGYLGIDRDITERKRAEKALGDKDAKLHELAERLNYHIENSPMAVIEWGPDMRLIRWAGAAERIFGWRPDEVIGKRMEEFPWIYREDESQVVQVSAELRSGADPQRFSCARHGQMLGG
jgi:PAS domain S-box-containing protein